MQKKCKACVYSVRHERTFGGTPLAGGPKLQHKLHSLRLFFLFFLRICFFFTTFAAIF